MVENLINCLAIFLLCVLCAGIVIPQILLIAFRKQLFDVPDERKIHHSLVPRLGGIAFKPVILFAMFLVIGVNLQLSNENVLELSLDAVCPLIFSFSAMVLLYLVGIADDMIGVKYRAKFIAQILAALMIIAGGTWIDNLHGVLGIYGISPWVGYPFTVLVIVFIINAINLIDGIDGLASGLSATASLVYGFTFLMTEDYLYAMLSFATLGVLVPFFYYNVFGDPSKQRKIFMGDTGSLSIGIILAFLSIRIAMYPLNRCIINVNPLILAFTPLFVPCCDVVRVYMRRVRNGKNPFLPDKTHIHHKLLGVGLRQRPAMVTIVSCSLLLVITNILLSKYLNINLILVGDLAFWILVNIWLSRRAKTLNPQNYI